MESRPLASKGLYQRTASLEYLERCAAETGFTVATLEKVARLGELADDMGRHPLLRQVLVLKGGTALNLGYGAPSRLSVDLDFNYIGVAERSDMLEDRPLTRIRSPTSCQSSPQAAGAARSQRTHASADVAAGHQDSAATPDRRLYEQQRPGRSVTGTSAGGSPAFAKTP